MRFADLMGQTLGTLTHNIARTLLTILGIVIGISSVILMLSLGYGAQAQVQNRIASVGAQIINVTVDDPHYTLTVADVKALRETLPNIEGVSGVLQSNGEVVLEGDSYGANFYSADESYGVVQGFTYINGRYFTEQEFTERQRVVLIPKTFAEDLFGDSSAALGQKLTIKENLYTIVGVLDSQGSGGFSQGGAVYFPFSTYISAIDNKDTVTVIAIRASSVEIIPALKPFILAQLNVRHSRSTNDDVFKASDLTGVLETATQVTEIFTLLLGAVASISLIVGGIGIMNMMLTTVTERTREIGVRKALGAKRRQITIQFLTEAILLTFLGGIIGILIGVGMSIAVSQIMPFDAVVTTGSIIMATLFSASVGVFFGYYPAQKAASLNPIEALRHE